MLIYIAESESKTGEEECIQSGEITWSNVTG